MYHIGLIIFREFLEIAILIGMFGAAAQHIRGMNFYLIVGIIAGCIASIILAYFMHSLYESLEGYGSEVFRFTITLITILMIGWTVIWMKNHNYKIKLHIERLTQLINEGVVSKSIFAFVVASTIFREGAEIVLIIESIVSNQKNIASEYMRGVIIGAIAGIACGGAIYIGLLKFASRYIFSLLTFFMTLLASGLAAEEAKLLISTGIINILNYHLWDTSWLVSNESIVGKILRVLIGYSAKPTMLEIIFYVGTFLTITLLAKIFTGKRS